MHDAVDSLSPTVWIIALLLSTCAAVFAISRMRMPWRNRLPSIVAVVTGGALGALGIRMSSAESPQRALAIVTMVLLVVFAGAIALTWFNLFRTLASAPRSAPSGWFADPTRKHELRYWDGAAWTAHVSDAGTTTTDTE